jgi:NarL family two-component system response regulator LiaR
MAAESMSGRIRVVVVDDHKVVQTGLRSYLESFPDMEVVGAASSGEEVLKKLEDWLPDVVVMDLRMPGGMDGVEATRRVRALSPHTQVVVLTADTDDARVVGALRAGAIGYVRKDADPQVFLAAVRGAARGRSVLDPAVAGSVLQDLAQGASLTEPLSERETEVLHQLAHGRTNREIAEALHISEDTVKTHVGNILSKLQLAHRTQAVIYALKQGLLSLDDIKL